MGHGQLSRRVGRNESVNHAGNVTFALLAGAVGTWVAQSWIFYASGLIAIGTICSALAIRSGDIDNLVARGAAARETGNESAHVASFRDLLQIGTIWIFTISVVLFHFANAAMLPLVGELLSKGKDGKSSF